MLLPRGGPRASLLDRLYETASPEWHFVESMRARLPPAVEVRQLDATRTGLPDGSFDLAVCSLLLHHLPPEAACALLREGTRVARRLLIVDGWRHPAMLAISPLFFAIGNYAAFHDGVISLRKMYGRDALTHMARIAGPQISVDIRFRLPGYLTCVASRNP